MNPSIAHRLTNGKKEVLNFNFHSLPKPLNIPVATENLLLVKEVFDRRKIKFWLMYGTLLGAVRIGNFFSYDKDTDIGVFEKNTDLIYDALLELQTKGFEIIRTIKDDAIVTILRNQMYIDFYFMSRYGKLWRCDGNYFPKDYYSAFKEHPFLKTTFLVPEKTTEFLEDHYCGKKWHIDRFNRTAKMFIRDMEYWQNAYKKPHVIYPSNFAKNCLLWFKQKSKILDIGCGCGRDSFFFNQKGFKVTGIDRAFQPNELDVKFINKDICKLAGFPIDNVYCRFTLHSLDVKKESIFFDWCFRNMQSNGILAIEGRSVRDGLYGQGILGPDKDSWITDHYRRFLDEDELVNKLQDIGFTVVWHFSKIDHIKHSGENPLIVRIFAKK